MSKTVRLRLNTPRRRIYHIFTLFSLFSLILLNSNLINWPTTRLPWRVTYAAGTDFTLYDDALAPDWQDWSWNSDINFSNTNPNHSGTAATAVTLGEAWAALSLRAPSPLIGGLYTAVTFWIYGGANPSQLQFSIQQTDSGSQSNQVAIDAPAGVWTQFTVNLSALGNPSTLARLNWQDRTGAAQPTFYIDDITLVGASSPSGLSGTIHVNTGGTPITVDSRILGTNLPTWLGQASLENVTFRARTAASGVSVLRLPGGSYSNNYGWYSCEMRANQANTLPCGKGWESWGARPTDFIHFLKATGKVGMWVVSPNGTPQEAAAVVAFFNAPITDTTPIGVDSRGMDWKTSGYWAQLRANHGNADPVGIQLWAVGNEVYGGKPSSGGALCQAWGWEEVWTCDGTEYVNGANDHAGYTAFRNAMRAVDPTIQLGAVGQYPATDYNNWGNKVLTAAGATMDYYDIHPYAYNTLPATFAEVLAQPETVWPAIRADLNTAYNTKASGRQIPAGVTEYNLVAGQDYDKGQWMTRAVNGLFIADTIGQMIQNGFVIANQWALSNGRASNGTEYGLLHGDNHWYRSPQYYVFPLWARFGDQMLPTSSTLNAATQLSVYGGRVDTTTISLLAINKTSAPITGTITLDAPNGTLNITGGTADVVSAATLSDQAVLYNNVSNPADDLSDAPSLPVNSAGSTVTYLFAPNSITLLRLQTDPTNATVTPPATTIPIPTTATDTPILGPTAPPTPLESQTPTAPQTATPVATATFVPTAATPAPNAIFLPLIKHE